jgi:hypothetical protein
MAPPTMAIMAAEPVSTNAAASRVELPTSVRLPQNAIPPAGMLPAPKQAPAGYAATSSQGLQAAGGDVRSLMSGK